ncbi:MAG: acyl carrier protein [Candidatus Korobacteraceae bacterium]
MKVSGVIENGNPTSRIRKFILQTFPLARRRNITDSADLLESGIIDSLGVLDLVTFLQQEFAVSVDDDDLTPDNFKSIECMAQFVERMLEPQSRSLQ